MTESYVATLEAAVAAADGFVYSGSDQSERQATYTEYRRVRAMLDPGRGRPARLAPSYPNPDRCHCGHLNASCDLPTKGTT